jgi:hypothetical protein
MLIELFIGSVIIGVIIGLIGIGGGILLLPLLVYYDFSFQQAVAISLFLNTIPNALPGLYLYYQHGFLDFNAAIIVAVGSILGGVAGAYIGTNNYIDDRTLYRIYTVFLIMTAIYLYFYYCYGYCQREGYRKNKKIKNDNIIKQ